MLPSLDSSALLGGDWAGAAAVAAAGLAAAGLLSTLFLLLAGAGRLPGGVAVTAIVMLACSAFGGDAVFAAPGADAAASIGGYPLTITVATLAVLVALFWGRLRSRRPGLGEALLQAVRTGLVFAVAVGLIALVVRTHLTGTGFGTGLLPAGSTLHSSVPGAVLGSFLLSTLCCVGACLRKREWLTGWLLTARDLLAAPLAGLAAALLTAIAGTVVGLLVAAVVLGNSPGDTLNKATGDTSGQDVAAGLGILAMALPTLALYGLYLGIGAAFASTGSGALNRAFGSFDGTIDVHYRVTTLADQNSLWWLASIGAIVSLLVGALVVAHLAGTVERARRTLLVFVALLLVVTPLLTHLSAVYGQVRSQGSVAQGRVGISTPGATLAVLLGGLIVVLVASAIAPILLPLPTALSAPTGPLPAVGRAGYPAAPGLPPPFERGRPDPGAPVQPPRLESAAPASAPEADQPSSYRLAPYQPGADRPEVERPAPGNSVQAEAYRRVVGRAAAQPTPEATPEDRQ